MAILKIRATGVAVAAALLAASFHEAAMAQAQLPEPLDAYVARSMAESEVPGLAVAVVRGDDPPIVQGFGVRRLGRREPVDADTVFSIASMAKAFTSAAAAVLVDEGKIDWNDRVARLLPGMEFSDPWLTRNITLADLLSHRTGLQPANNMWRITGIDRAEVLRRVRYLEPAAPFRTQQVYNNVLYAVAGEAIGAAAGTSWEELVRTRLVRPLGMARTTVSIRADEGNVAAPHVVIDGRQQPIRPSLVLNIGPAAEVNSTARDMVRWMRFQLGGGELDGRRIVSARSMQAMHEPWVIFPTTPAMRAARQVHFFGAYGLGWNVMDYRGHKLIWHGGAADGMLSYIALLPEPRIGVVVLINSWKGAPFLHGDIVSRIFDHYLGLPTRDYSAETLGRIRDAQARAAAAPASPTPAGLPPMDLAAYEGTYGNDLYGPVGIRREGQGLVLRMGEGESADLRPLNRDTFTVRWRNRVIGQDDDTKVTFALDGHGKVARLTMQVRHDLIEAKRTDPSVPAR